MALLGGEEGVEDARQVLGADAAAGVAHGDAHATCIVHRVAVDRLQRQRAAGGHGLHGIDDEVDQHLLQLLQVDLHPATRAEALHHPDLGARQMLARQHEAVGERGVHVDVLDVAGELARAGELQQLGDDQADASDLLVDQADLVGHRLRRGAELLAQQVEVALDHRGGVADLVRHTGSELADRGELLAHHQAALGGA